MEIHQAYAEELAKAVSKLPLEAIYEAAERIILQIYTGDQRRRIFICGNGGSASTASHITADLMKNTRKLFNVICFNDNIALMTAYANDISYAEIFGQQAARLADKMDLAILISTSGESENVVRLADVLQSWDVYTIGLMGANKESRLAKLVNLPIHIESNNIGVVEDLHLSIGHIWTELLRSW